MNDDRNTDLDIAQGRTNQEIMRAIGRLEGKVDSVILAQQNYQTTIAEHEKRISENADELTGIRVKIGVIGALIGAGASFAGNWLWQKLTGHM